MDELTEAVLQCCTTVRKENGIAEEPDLSTQLTRENGIDSMGIVNLVIELEEALEIDLDQYLARIRGSRTVSELISVIREAAEKENGKERAQ